jgi:hypothetical protein
MKSGELAGLEKSLGDTSKPPAEGSRRKCASKLPEYELLVFEDEKFDDMIRI